MEKGMYARLPSSTIDDVTEGAFVMTDETIFFSTIFYFISQYQHAWNMIVANLRGSRAIPEDSSKFECNILVDNAP